MPLDVGDLVRVRGHEWLGKPLGIVTEVRALVHDQTQTHYTAVTVVIGTQAFTFPEEAFEVVNPTERNRN